MLAALIIGLICAAFGALLTWLFGAPDRKLARRALEFQTAASQAQLRVAELEAEQNRRDFFDRFTPDTKLHGASPKDQFLRVSAPEQFEISLVEYLNADGAKVASQAVTRSAATSIDIPIERANLTKIRNVGPVVSTWDRSASAVLRLTLHKDGLHKTITFQALAKPEMVGSTIYEQLIG
jgi:hypothetical protein